MSDVVKSGKPVLVAVGTGTYSQLKNDPRELGKQIFANRIGALKTQSKHELYVFVIWVCIHI